MGPKPGMNSPEQGGILWACKCSYTNKCR